MKNIWNFLLLTFIVLFTGCNHNDLKFNNPEKQFVYVEEQIMVSVCHKETGACLPLGEGRGRASGVLISHDKKENKSYYLTAGHVCITDVGLPPNEDFEPKIDSEFHLLAYDGSNNVAQVVAVDEEHDLCILSTKRVRTPPAVIERKELKRHIQIINVAAPAGLWSSKTMIHFTGEFQGNFKGAHNELKEEVAMYTIAAQKGSSGSPVYDPQTGRLVGIITSVMPPSYDISFGPTLKQINEFVDANIP